MVREVGKHWWSTGFLFFKWYYIIFRHYILSVSKRVVEYCVCVCVCGCVG